MNYKHSNQPYCSKCKKDLPLDQLMKYANNKLANGTWKQYYNCQPCNAKRASKYRKTPTGIKATLRSIRKYAKANPLRRIAWNKASSIPLEPCEECGTKKNVHRHHPDITKPLLVKFLCALHHKRLHLSL